ncbi:MAG: DUF4270 family protein [Bacteroidota bacterium]|nr:DUF4270 family protein [Bacteroidota bacterium]
MYKTKSLFVLLFFSLTIIFSCNEKSDVGLSVIPKNRQLNLQITDTFTLNSYSQLMDSVSGSGGSKLLIGNYTDPIFGNTQAHSAVQFTKSGTSYLHDSIPADSVYIYLSYTEDEPRAYGDSTIEQTINVYRLTENLQHDSSYNATKPVGELHDNELMGSVTVSTAYNPDSLIRIKLDDSWADYLTKAEDSTVYEYGEDFRAYFNGVVLTTAGGADASIISLNLNSESLLKVYYHHESDADSAREALFPIDSYCARLNMFEHDYSGTPAQNQLQNPESHGDSLVYIQGMNGLRLKVDIPHLTQLIPEGNIAVHRAEIVLETAPEEQSGESIYPASPHMLISAVGPDGEYLLLQDYLNESGYGNVAYNDINQYRFDVAFYIQQILRGTATNNGFYIFTSAGSQKFYRTVIKGPQHSSPLRLILTYSHL